MAIPNLKMNNGYHIPQIGLGLWQVKSQTEFDNMFDAAIAAGYRHFDSAQAYGNEAMLGAAIKRHKLKRDDVFVTTKIAVQHFGYKHVKQAFDESLKRLDMEYVDLLLLHFPVTALRQKSWTALEEIQAAGQAKSIGVSNYTIRHLEEMQNYAKVMPAVNQVELHVFLQQPELLAYCAEQKIIVEAYSPLAHAKDMNNEVVNDIAKKHGKSYAQIMLRWLIQQGLVALPKSVTPQRIQQNIDIFDFKLDADDLDKLKAQDQDLRTCWSPVHIP